MAGVLGVNIDQPRGIQRAFEPCESFRKTGTRACPGRMNRASPCPSRHRSSRCNRDRRAGTRRARHRDRRVVATLHDEFAWPDAGGDVNAVHRDGSRPGSTPARAADDAEVGSKHGGRGSMRRSRGWPVEPSPWERARRRRGREGSLSGLKEHPHPGSLRSPPSPTSERVRKSADPPPKTGRDGLSVSPLLRRDALRDAAAASSPPP